MTLAQRIAEDLTKAMKSKDEFRLSCLRMLKTSLKHKQAENGNEINDEEIQYVISSMIRKNQEAAEEFRKGNREDLALKEEGEVKILYEYMPEQLSPAEIENVLREIISELSATNLKDLGKVMKVAMGRIAEKAQGKEVNQIAKKLLS
jgi:uncharacterized protein YqeY